MTIYEVDVKFAHNGMVYRVTTNENTNKCTLWAGEVAPNMVLLENVTKRKARNYLRDLGVPTIMLTWGINDGER